MLCLTVKNQDQFTELYKSGKELMTSEATKCRDEAKD